MQIHQALEILGISSNYTEETLKKKYRQLVSRNHPDKFPGCDESTLKFQEIITTNINLAYDFLYSRLFSEVDFSASANESGVPEKLFGRIPVHPNHKDESFRRLWHEIRSIRSKKDFSLAMELYSLSITYLLQDFKKFPDIDGILHNYIRDYSSILVGIGKYYDAFALVKLSIINNFRSYYDYNHPSSLLFSSIIKTRHQQKAIKIWEDLFIGDILITHIPTQWSIIYTYFINNRLSKIYECIENGFLAIDPDDLSLAEKISRYDLIVINEKKQIAKKFKDPVVYDNYLEEQRKKAEQERIYKGKLIRILITSQPMLNDNEFPSKYPKSSEIIEFHKDANLASPEFEIDKTIAGFTGMHGSNAKFSPRECKEEALAIFHSLVKPPEPKKETQRTIKQKDKKPAKKIK